MEKLAFVVLLIIVGYVLLRKPKEPQVELEYRTEGADKVTRVILSRTDDVSYIPDGSDIFRRLRIGEPRGRGTLMIQRAPPPGNYPALAVETISVEYVNCRFV